MKLWEMLKGPRHALKKVKFIYEPYRKIKIDYVLKKRNQYLNENGLQLVMDIDHALEKTNACFFADGGTLLGLVRDGKLIKWDLDVDYGIYITPDFSWKDLEKSLNEIGFVLDHQFRFKNEITEQTYRKGFASVDFFNHFNDETNTYFYAYYSKQGYKYDELNKVHVQLFKTRLISGTKPLSINGCRVHVPIEAERYLEDLYSNTWRIPNPNWEQGSGPACIEMGDSEFGFSESFR